MKRRGHIYPFICLVTITLSLAAAAVASAQGFMPPPAPVPSVEPYPLAPPFVPAPPGTRPSLMYGRFYFQAGAKYRSLDSLRFDIIGGEQSLLAATGTVPFGPEVAGDFGVGTGRDGFLGGGGTSWDYNNGFLSGDVTPFPGVQIGCTDPAPANPACGPVDATWTYSTESPELGRQTFIVGSADCCNGLIVPGHIGSWGLTDATVQVNNPNSIVGTTQITFQVTEPDSLAFLVNTTPAINRETGPKLWSPSFEAGYQLTNFFDVFSTFSWFSVCKSVGLLNVLQGRGARVLIEDTFPFVSDQEGGWPVGAFLSSQTVIGDTSAHIYQLTPNSPLRGIFPNRQFLTQQDDSVPLQNIQETVNNRVEISVYETRLGGRSWVPLFGLGRLGITAGGTFMPAYYKITQNRNYVALGPAFPEEPPFLVVPGQLLFHVSNKHEDWHPHYGAFVGSDLELGNGIYYINGSIDFTWANTQTYTIDAVETSFNPGGMTIGATAGLHF